MGTPIQRRDIIQLSEEGSAEGPAVKGTWIRGDGSTHHVTVIDKSSISADERAAYEKSSQLFVDTGTHILLFDKEIVQEGASLGGEDVEKAFKNLYGEKAPVMILGGSLSSEEFRQVQLEKEGPQVVREGLFASKMVQYSAETHMLFVKNLRAEEQRVDPNVAKSKAYLDLRSQLIREAEISFEGKAKPHLEKIGKDSFLFLCEKNLDDESFILVSQPVTVPAFVKLSKDQIESLCIKATLEGRASRIVFFKGEPWRLECANISGGPISFSTFKTNIRLKEGASEKTKIISAIYKKLFSEKVGAQSPLPKRLLERADKAGEASMFVRIDKQIYRAKVKKIDEKSFALDCQNIKGGEGLSSEEIGSLNPSEQQMQVVSKGSATPRFVQYSIETKTLHVQNPKMDDSSIDPGVVGEKQYFSVRAELMLEALRDPTGRSVQFLRIGNECVRIRCEKNKEGSFVITSELAKLTQRAFSQKDQPVFDSIMDVLQSGKREEGEPKPVLPFLFKQAEKTGEASAFVTVNDRLYRAKITKNTDGSFSVDYTEPSLREEDLKTITPEDAKGIRTRKDTLLMTLFSLALQAAAGQKKKAEAYFPHAVVQLHIKEDGTVSVGIGRFLAAGGFKEVQRIVKGGVRDKIYAEALLKDVSGRLELEEEAAMMEKFAGPNLLKLRKYFVRTVVRYDAETGAPSCVQQIGIKSEFCDKGVAFSLLKNPPQSPEEKLKRFCIVHDAARALAYIHNYSEDRDPSGEIIRYAHMDFKPENLFLKTKADGSIEAILGDLDPQPEGASSVTTPEFGDWEIRQSCIEDRPCESSQKNDVWALGITLFEAMYGISENPLRSPEIKDEESFKRAHQALLSRLGNTPADELTRKMLILDREERPSLTPKLLQEFDAVEAVLG